MLACSVDKTLLVAVIFPVFGNPNPENRKNGGGIVLYVCDLYIFVCDKEWLSLLL